VRAAEHPDGVLRVLRGHKDYIAVAQVSLADFFQGSSTLDNIFKSLGDAIQIAPEGQHPT
jgi:hypothetical protein